MVLLAIDVRRGVNIPLPPPILGRPAPIDGREEERDVLGVTGALGLPPIPRFGVLDRVIGVLGCKLIGGARPVECVGVSGSPSKPPVGSSSNFRILLGGRRFIAACK